MPDEIGPDELIGEYPAVEYVPPHGRFWIDVLIRLGEMISWEDVAANSDELRLGGLVV